MILVNKNKVKTFFLEELSILGILLGVMFTFLPFISYLDKFLHSLPGYAWLGIFIAGIALLVKYWNVIFPEKKHSIKTDIYAVRIIITIFIYISIDYCYFHTHLAYITYSLIAVLLTIFLMIRSYIGYFYTEIAYTNSIKHRKINKNTRYSLVRVEESKILNEKKYPSELINSKRITYEIYVDNETDKPIKTEEYDLITIKIREHDKWSNYRRLGDADYHLLKEIDSWISLKKNSMSNPYPMIHESCDKFNTKEIIERIINAINNEQIAVIGLLGKWGAGKSTIINFVENRLKVISLNNKNQKNPLYITTSFSTWDYKDVNVLTEVFFNKISNEIKPYCNNSFRLKIATRNLIKNLSSVSYSGLYFDLQSYFNSNIGDSKVCLTEMLDHGSIPKLVMFIDDLDRITPDSVSHVLKLIQIISDLPKINIIIAMDREKIQGNNLSENFLDKILHTTVYLPLPKAIESKQYLEKAIKDYSNAKNVVLEEDEHEEFRQALNDNDYGKDLIFTFLDSPRTIIKVISETLMEYFHIKEASNRPLRFFDLFILNIFKQKHPDVFEKLKEKQVEIMYHLDFNVCNLRHNFHGEDKVSDIQTNDPNKIDSKATKSLLNYLFELENNESSKKQRALAKLIFPFLFYDKKPNNFTDYSYDFCIKKKISSPIFYSAYFLNHDSNLIKDFVAIINDFKEVIPKLNSVIKSEDGDKLSDIFEKWKDYFFDAEYCFIWGLFNYVTFSKIKEYPKEQFEISLSLVLNIEKFYSEAFNFVEYNKNNPQLFHALQLFAQTMSYSLIDLCGKDKIQDALYEKYPIERPPLISLLFRYMHSRT